MPNETYRIFLASTLWIVGTIFKRYLAQTGPVAGVGACIGAWPEKILSRAKAR